MTDWHLTIDCIDPAPLVPFWAEVLGYVVQPAPEGFATWNDWYLSVGVPPEELDLTGDGADRICDPTGRRPNIWFQPVPEGKVVKNRLHIDVYVTGGRSTPIEERRRLVDARVAELLALGATIEHTDTGDGHHHVTMRDPAGNEFCLA